MLEEFFGWVDTLKKELAEPVITFRLEYGGALRNEHKSMYKVIMFVSTMDIIELRASTVEELMQQLKERAALLPVEYAAHNAELAARFGKAKGMVSAVNTMTLDDLFSRINT